MDTHISRSLYINQRGLACVMELLLGNPWQVE